jgi:hypothetical protein
VPPLIEPNEPLTDPKAPVLAAMVAAGTGTRSGTGVIADSAAAGAAGATGAAVGTDASGGAATAVGVVGGALEIEPKPWATATLVPDKSAINSRKRNNSVETRFKVMARDFIAARAFLLCGVSRSTPE